MHKTRNPATFGTLYIDMWFLFIVFIIIIIRLTKTPQELLFDPQATQARGRGSQESSSLSPSSNKQKGPEKWFDKMWIVRLDTRAKVDYQEYKIFTRAHIIKNQSGGHSCAIRRKDNFHICGIDKLVVEDGELKTIIPMTGRIDDLEKHVAQFFFVFVCKTPGCNAVFSFKNKALSHLAKKRRG